MGFDGVDDVIWPSLLLQEFCSPGWVFLSRRVPLVVEIVDEAGDASLLFVLAELASIGPHGCLYSQGMLDKALVLRVLGEQSPSLFSIHVLCGCLLVWYLTKRANVNIPLTANIILENLRGGKEADGKMRDIML